VLQNKFVNNAGVQNAGGVAQMRDTVEGLLGRYVTYLSVPNGVFNAAKHIANMAQHKADIDGRNYASIAGGVLYATCVLLGYRLDIKELSKHATVTDSTIKL
jgi:transcription initiation factor TFIIB